MQYQNRGFKLAGITVLFLTGVAAGTLRALTRRSEGIVPPGVRIAGRDFGGKPVGGARAFLDDWRKQQLARHITLSLPPETRIQHLWQPKRSDLGAEVDVDATLAKAQSVGQDDGAFERLVSWFRGREPVDVAPVWKADSGKIKAYVVKNIARRVRHDPRNARFLALKDGFRIVPEAPGTRLDLDRAMDLLRQQILKDPVDPLVLPVTTAAPHVTTADLRDIQGEVSRFRTSYSERGNRARNIMVACSHINGTVLKPGDIFSYNKVVGPRDSGSGFRLAPVIISGKLKPGMGGGVCQVSSTLYNAVLLADLKIVQRTHHAFPVHYLPAGRDATVAYGSLDFQFQNNTDGPIAIGSSGAGGEVLMRVFGKPNPGRTVSIERTRVSSWGPPTQIVHDGALRAGARDVVDRGHAGHRVTVWRIVKESGKVVRREVLSQDHYQAFPRVIAVGTRAVAHRPPPKAPAVGPVPTVPGASALPSAPPGAVGPG